MSGTTPVVPVLPNELLMQVILFSQVEDLPVFLFVCRYTYQLVCQRAYRKAIFPDSATMQDIITFCQKHGQALQTIKLPQGHYYSDTFFMLLSQLCPQLLYLQSSITPKQLKRLIPNLQRSCFMLTHVPTDVDEDLLQSEDYSLESLPCCSSFFVFPTNACTSDPTTALTHISHYFHHPGALRNAILPTFGPDLLSLTLNPYDALTPTVARLIVKQCPRLRYLIAPAVKAEGLWMMLRWCETLVAIVVGHHDEPVPDDDDDDLDHYPVSLYSTIDSENERAVATVEQHKRVWCVHARRKDTHPFNSAEERKSWHIGIIPRK
ncbi:hypothetical protein BCR43DRAFT_487524 [Syncephalastrum racemosum]|uniref:F-box domain-containing protein n=1 Tax=Syncephalastrum racemosum TaxID=13706 RepID=A0A1X2HR14_SYNRA|nr:hypothetical protein BCR43DRAFT_487524 [Syncephalastrum racemosum]